MTTALRHWPRRRWFLAAGAFPVLVFAFAAAGHGGLPGTTAAWWIWPWLLFNSALASVVVASYLAPPGTGKLIDVGCSPCATVAGLALAGGLLAYSSAPASAFTVTVATVLTVLALRKRLTDDRSCAAPLAPRAAAAPEGHRSADADADADELGHAIAISGDSRRGARGHAGP